MEAVPVGQPLLQYGFYKVSTSIFQGKAKD